MLPSVTLFGLTLRTYSALLAAAIILSIGWAVNRLSRLRFARAIDICLCMLVGGYLLARVEYIALHGSYFSTVTLAPLEWVFPTHEGGLTWHGALIGGLIGMAIGAALFGVKGLNRGVWWAAFAPALPLIALSGWLGCAAEGCAYGLEVDTLAHYSPLAVVETRDIYGIVAPRYATQRDGALLSIGVGLGMLALYRRNMNAARVFWIGAAVFSAGMLLIGFYRADEVPRWFGLRADQVLDALVCAWGGALALLARRKL